jgi:hypothetical protein
MTVLKPPQKKMPEINPTESKAINEYLVLGRLSLVQKPELLSDMVFLLSPIMMRYLPVATPGDVA